MALNKSLLLRRLKEKLKKQLKQYDDVEDIIIFGSLVKDKFKPKDVDVAIIMEKKDYDIVQKIHKQISTFEVPIHMSILLFKEIYTEPKFWKSIFVEGFSIKRNKYLREIVNIKPVEIYEYHIDKMTPTEKMQFNRGFNETMHSTSAFRIGAGSVVVPEEKTGKFDDFFDSWDKKARKKVFKAILL